MVKIRERQLKRHKRDFWTYYRFGRLYRGFLPWHIDSLTKGDTDTLRCFVAMENGTKEVSPKQPRLLKAVLEGKKKLNWQINEWAAGRADGTLTAFCVQELKDAFPWLPNWVWEALENMRWKILFSKPKGGYKFL